MKISDTIKSRLLVEKFAIPCLLFASTLAVSLFLIGQSNALNKNERDSTTHRLLSLQSAQIERNLTLALTSTYVLAKEVKDNSGSVTNFDNSASAILQLIPGARNIQLAPDGVTQYVYPLAGNEKIIGHDILNDESRNSEALKAISTRSLTLAGPFKLIQGGVGVVGRNPIFLDVYGRSDFWGFATALILLDDLLDQAGFCNLLCETYNYELGKPTIESESQMHVFASGGDPLSSNALSHEIVVPNGTWILRLEPKYTGSTANQIALYFLCLILATLLSYCSFIILKEPEKLRKLVKHQTQEMQELAYKDPLTGLPNRRMFCETLRSYFSLAKNNSSALILILIDLDQFKYVNDTLGHDIGDELLCNVGRKLLHCLPKSAHLARLGGDEFTVTLHSSEDTALAEYYAENIISALRIPLSIKGNVVHASACIGIATLDHSTDSASELLKHADLALYEAKSIGSGRFEHFSERISQDVERTARLSNDLKSAIKNSEFELLYQPISNAKTGTVEKAEALLRWHHPVLGDVSPLELIPLAERTGMIEKIGLWVFKTAASQAKLWQNTEYQNIQISINVSPVQFRSQEQINAWFRILQDLELDGSNILIEITEGSILEGTKNIEHIFEQLHEKGIELALDDFGTGYSSMAYLRQFDIDYIKIDQSFVQNLPSNADDIILCQAIIAIASKLDLKVVAEGVESDEQRQLLTDEGCDYIQGYVLSKPVDAQTFESLFLLTQNNREKTRNQKVLAFRAPNRGSAKPSNR